MITPKNKTSLTRAMLVSLTEKSKPRFCLFCLVLKTIKFDFLKFMDSLLTVKQSDNLINLHLQLVRVNSSFYVSKIYLYYLQIRLNPTEIINI